MIEDIFRPGDLWSLNELEAMVADRDIFAFETVYVSWNFFESPTSRLRALRLMFRSRAVPTGQAAEWVQRGGPMPTEMCLEEPRRKKYVPLAQRN
jgi:hypothetical protein